MRVIILNKKRLGVTVIILGLMIVLFGMEKTFDHRLKDAALMYTSSGVMAEYEGLDKNIKYKLPKDWIVNEEKFSGNEIIYHNNFTSKDQSIRGFVEAWNFKGDLKSFLEKGRDVAFNKVNTKYQSYSVSPVKIKNYDGFLLSYVVDTGANNNYRGYEYFINSSDRFYRFSFFIKESNYKETMPTIFKNIVDTVELIK
jgi:hypothetical protein